MNGPTKNIPQFSVKNVYELPNVSKILNVCATPKLDETHPIGCLIVAVNGKIIGVHKDPESFQESQATEKANLVTFALREGLHQCFFWHCWRDNSSLSIA